MAAHYSNFTNSKISIAMVSDMKYITVNTSSYEFAHGKKPRGYGSWVFEFAGGFAHIQGTYAEAKQQAKAKAHRLGVHSIKLSS